MESPLLLLPGNEQLRGHTKLSTDIREPNKKPSRNSPENSFLKIETVRELKRFIYVGLM